MSSAWRVVLARAGCLLVLTGLLAACGGGGGGADPAGGGATVSAPTITTQPVSLAVSDGQAASFAVTVSGSSPLSYQWQANGVAIAGATSESYAQPAASLADNGTRYTVTVSNGAGSANSTAATLTVNPIPAAITAAPQPVTVTAGQPASFSVTTTGSAPVALQWTRDGADIASATTASLTLAAVTLADNGARFAVRASNAGGSVTSPEALLTVAPIAAGIVTQPASLTASVGQSVLFSVVASGSEPLSYQWRRDGVPIPGATTASYSLAAVALADGGAQFTVAVSNAGGTVISAAAVLTVAAVPPTITTQPQPQIVTDGASATFNVVASGTPPLVYQWRKNGTPLGSNAPTLTLAAVTTGDSGATITVTVSNPSPSTATSNGALLTVAPRAPAITVQPQPQTAADGSTATFSVTATGTAPLHYQWKRNGTNVGTDSASYTTPALTLANDGASYVVVVSNAAATTATSIAASLTVTPIPPSITTQPQPQSVSAGSTATFTVTATGSAPLHYQWKRDGTSVGADSASYTTGVLGTGDSGASFTVLVSNVSSTTATSNAATLTVAATDLQILAGAIGGTGYYDGTGGAARFYNPFGIATDSSGNAYIADQSNHLIRRVTPTGVVTTLAGSPGAASFVDGTGTAARFNTPTDLTVYEPTPGDVRLYIADSGNNRIRQLVVATGAVTTLAGSVAGSADGSGSSAHFRSPSGITLSGGQLFVADTNNQTLRLVTLAGVVTTWAGSAQQSGSTDGNGSSARFNGPLGLAADVAGTLYVADCSNNIIRSVSSTQDVTTLAGTPGVSGNVDGAPSAARFRCPSGLVVDGNGSNLYVADSNNRTVRRIPLPSGNVSTYAGTPGAGGTAGADGAIDGPVGTARFGQPYGLALDPLGNLLLTDATNSEIRQIDLSNDVVATLAGSIGGRGYADGTGTSARFNDPHNVALDADGNLYVSDHGNVVIRKITPGGVVSTLAGNPGVAGSANGTGSAARFGGPRGLSVDSAGNIFVADAANNTIRRITPQGVVTTLAGSPIASGFVDGTGAAARFSNPVGVVVDGNGNVYVSDYNNNAIRKITPAGVVTTLAGGGPSLPGTTDGTGTAARFRGPRGVAIDGMGNVIVADRDNGTIRLVTPGGDVSTLAGLGGNSGYADGTGSSARFNWPNTPAVDAAGNIYVPDANNSAIRKITPLGVVTTVVGHPPPGALRTVVLGALPGGLNGPSGVVVIPGTPIRLIIAESAENALLIATLP